VGNVLINVNHLAIGVGLAEASDHVSFRDRAVLLATIRSWRTSPLIAEFEEGRLSPEGFYARMRDVYRLTASFERFRAIWNSGFSENTPVVEIIGRLHGGTRLLALSNTDPLHFEYLCATFSILERMEDTILSYRVGRRKPASEIFACALERAGVHPHQAWYVDDIADFVDAAERIGLRGIPYRTAPELADALGIG